MQFKTPLSIISLLTSFLSSAPLAPTGTPSPIPTAAPIPERIFDFCEANVRFGQRNSGTAAQRQVKWFEPEADGLGLMCRITVNQDDGVIYGFSMEGVLGTDIHSNEVFAVAFAGRVRSTDDEQGLGRAQLFLGEGMAPWRTIVNQPVKLGREWKSFIFTGRSGWELPHPLFVIQMGGRSQVLDVKDLVLVRFPPGTTLDQVGPKVLQADALIRMVRLQK